MAVPAALDQAGQRPGGGASREDGGVEGALLDAEMVAEDAFEQAAHVERRPSIPVFEQAILRQGRPVADDTATLQRTARQQRRRAGAVVSAGSAVDPGGAAELGDSDDQGVAPRRS